MKAFRIVLHSIALISSILLILAIPIDKEIKQIFLYVLITYSFSALLYSVIRELFLFSFPRKIGLLGAFAFFSYSFIFKNIKFIDMMHLEFLIISISCVIAISLLILTLLNVSIHFNYRKIKISAFKRLYLINSLFCIILLIVMVAIVFSLEKGWNNISLNRILAIGLVIVPFFNKDYIRGLTRKFKNSKNLSSLGLSLEHLGKLGRIKNFVFTKDKIISTGIFQTSESDYRSTVRVTTALQIAHKLSKEWNPRYTKLFVLDTFEPFELKYNIVQKDENGITVIDDDACMYHLGNSTYVKDKIKSMDKANLFLLKNDIPIAKFRINEKIATDKIELINQLDYLGNTLFIHNGNVQDLGHDYTIVFDKIYSGVNEQKQIELLKALEKKGATAFFTTKAPKDVINSVCFYITSNIDVQSDNDKIVLDPQSISKVPEMVRVSKKVHTFFKYTLLLSLATQIILGIIALIFYNYFILLVALNFGFTILAEVLAIILNKKIVYLPSQPANLAHNHQAA